MVRSQAQSTRWIIPPRPLMSGGADSASIFKRVKMLTEEFDITLHYITLHYITLHYITLHHATLHYIALHHITSHHII